MPANPKVLIIDDDPSHLEVHSLIVRNAGFEPIPLLVRFSGADPLPEASIDLVLLDYRLNSVTTAPEIAREMRSRFPDAPIVLLSDFWSPPPDVAPFISQFVRKGEPARLVEVLRSHLSGK